MLFVGITFSDMSWEICGNLILRDFTVDIKLRFQIKLRDFYVAQYNAELKTDDSVFYGTSIAFYLLCQGHKSLKWMMWMDMKSSLWRMYINIYSCNKTFHEEWASLQI